MKNAKPIPNKIKVGLSTNDLGSLDHSMVEITAMGCVGMGSWQDSVNADGSNRSLINPQTSKGVLDLGRQVKITAVGNRLRLNDSKFGETLFGQNERLRLWSADTNLGICINNPKRLEKVTKENPKGIQELELFALNGKVRVSLYCSLDDYLKGVLHGEVPASYHPEAIKAQAVTARTYALNPRVDHSSDFCNVCDSYLCCQCFDGIPKNVPAAFAKAIAETSNETLSFQGKPILALFSSCAGGHTENYENCFSDYKTNAFPPAPLPYLKGIKEGPLPFWIDGSEQSLRTLFNSQNPDTCDSWTPKFRWTVELSDSVLEAQMHHVVETAMRTPDMAPWIVPPESKLFGRIYSFKVSQRGVAGTAIVLEIETSKGVWKFEKELVIRKIFHNAEIGLGLLKSARFFLEQEHDSHGALQKVVIRGLGWGHGVGLQQTGSQGLALRGKSYRAILAHYFTGAEIA